MLEGSGRAELLRALHTLKGNSGMLGRQGVAEVVHAVEAVFREAPAEWPRPELEILFELSGELRRTVEAIGTAEEDAPLRRARALAARLEGRNMDPRFGGDDRGERRDDGEERGDDGGERGDPGSGSGSGSGGDDEGGELGMSARNLGPRFRGDDDGEPRDDGGERRDPSSGTSGDEAGGGEVIRVPFAGLDTLLTRVGELVTLEARLGNLIALHRDTLDSAGIRRDFDDATERLARTTRFLQDTTMELRLVPVRRVFERFSTVVRDLARQNDLRIRVETTGDEVRIDKGLADALGEPLLHLVRNAVDHGFDAGHPSGTIRLSAVRVGDRVRVSVEDDGKGVDVEAVTERARRGGLIGPHDTLTERQALDLIFRAGFSTRREATTISGRGVGLDVVRRRVVALRGTLSVEPSTGGGMRFVLDLPLTLAIVTVVMFESAGEVLAIPAVDVEETLGRVAVRRAGGTEVVRSRGELIPVARPSALFGWEWNENGSSPAETFGVVIRRGERSAVILADRLLDQREVVVKGLPTQLGSLPAISGAAVTHEADIVLVLDAGGILDLNLDEHRR